MSRAALTPLLRGTVLGLSVLWLLAPSALGF